MELVLRELGRGGFAVELDGQTLVANSADPEHASARALIDRGIAGTAVAIDAKSGQPRMKFDISAFARTCVEESSRRGLRVRKWRGDRFQKAPLARGVRPENAFSGDGGISDPLEIAGALAEAAP